MAKKAKPAFEIPAEFSEKQKVAVEYARSGRSFFLSGCAGTGKSHVIHFIRDMLSEQMGKTVALTSSTGSAAEAIGGATIHSFSGIQLGEGTVQDIVSFVRGKPGSRKNWRDTDVLIIDEISMVSAKVFTALDLIAREARKYPDLPFGGMQVICIGDFYQLGPVRRKRNVKHPAVPYAFHSPSWHEMYPPATNVVVLDQVFRQTDPFFLDCLNRIREGVLDPTFITEVNRRSEVAKLYDDFGIVPTKLFSKNDEVESTNQEELARLPTKAYSFLAEDRMYGSYVDEKQFRVPKKLVLKEGAQVVMLQNTTDFKNGTRAVVVGFSPLPSSLSEKETDKEKDKDKPNAVQVRLMNGTVIVVRPVLFEIRRRKQIIATRSALPMKLGYALSIHRAQGMSIDCLQVDLRTTFSPAQAYTALSRARSIEGLRIIGLSPSVVYCDPSVHKYYTYLKGEGEFEVENVDSDDEGEE
jgi:ATP-dependent DNA helicase PIF1